MKIVYSFFFLLLGVPALSQEEVISAEEKSNSNSGFIFKNRKVSFTTPDDFLEMDFHFRIQNRLSFNVNEQNDKEVDFQLKYLRLGLEGSIFHHKFKYKTQIGLAPYDFHKDESGVSKILKDAYIAYVPNKHWYIIMGQAKMPGSRQQQTSSDKLQMTERTINYTNFAIDRDLGIQVHQLNEFKDRFSYNFKLAVTQGEGSHHYNHNKVGFAYTGGFELFPMGTFKDKGAYFEGDVLRESSPKLMISGAYQLNHRAQLAKGQSGRILHDNRDLHSLFGDVILKYKGFAFMAAYMARHTSDPLTLDTLTTDISHVHVGQGIDFQTSYVTKKQYEFIVRYSYQKVDKSVHSYQPNRSQYAVGLTKYIWGHQLKLQTEVGLEEYYYSNNTRKNSFYTRFQIEFGF